MEERAVSRFFLASGNRVQGSPVAVLPASACTAAWGAGGQLVVSQQDGNALQAVSVETGRPVTRTVVAPSVGGLCLVWAADALDRPGQGGGPLGTHATGALAWWREGLLAAGLGAGLLGALRWLRRRSGPASRRPAGPGPSDDGGSG